jgi:LytS/YehU family sensor histidine kinase
MQANSGVCRAFVTDGSVDITDTSQLMVFVRGIHSASEVHEEISSLLSLKGITTGEDLFLRRREALTPSKLRCEILPSVTADGDRNINGSLTGVGRIREEVTNVNSEKPRLF